MQPADHLDPEQLIGKRVTFKSDEDHCNCWHFRMQVQAAKVLRRSESTRAKAERMAAEGFDVGDLDLDDEVTRLWVWIESCPKFPRGCEAAVEQSCLQFEE